MSNNENLIQNRETTPSERRKNAKKAGEASGKTRKRNASLRSILKSLIKTNVETDDEELNKKLEEAGVDCTADAFIAIKLIQKALEGDLRAIELLMKLIGESNKSEQDIEMQKQDIEAKKIEMDIKKLEKKILEKKLEQDIIFENPFEGLTTEELRKLASKT